jgi:hypothetical protein
MKLADLADARCEIWLGRERRVCLSGEDVRFYVCGLRCKDHAPGRVIAWLAEQSAAAGDAG